MINMRENYSFLKVILCLHKANDKLIYIFLLIPVAYLGQESAGSY